MSELSLEQNPVYINYRMWKNVENQRAELNKQRREKNKQASSNLYRLIGATAVYCSSVLALNDRSKIYDLLGSASCIVLAVIFAYRAQEASEARRQWNKKRRDSQSAREDYQGVKGRYLEDIRGGNYTHLSLIVNPLIGTCFDQEDVHLARLEGARKRKERWLNRITKNTPYDRDDEEGEPSE